MALHYRPIKNLLKSMRRRQPIIVFVLIFNALR